MRIDKIFPCHEWYKSDTKEKLEECCTFLFQEGLLEEEIEQVISKIYWAIANEYGD